MITIEYSIAGAIQYAYGTGQWTHAQPLLNLHVHLAGDTSRRSGRAAGGRRRRGRTREVRRAASAAAEAQNCRAAPGAEGTGRGAAGEPACCDGHFSHYLWLISLDGADLANRATNLPTAKIKVHYFPYVFTF